MSFHEVRFPTGIARGATGGPQRLTEIVTLSSGHEERNTRWAQSRRRYNAGLGVRSVDDLHQVLTFFEARRGRLHAFRWKDHADFKSCPPSQAVSALDQQIGTGDGSTTGFQLIKNYADVAGDYQRIISKPVTGSVMVAVNGVVDASVIIDDVTGIVTFQTAPASGATISAGFEFDVPVRFDTDRMEINLSHFEAGQIPDVPVVEVRL
jgi:uncharacterized protein (TIGR02217 family)